MGRIIATFLPRLRSESEDVGNGSVGSLSSRQPATVGGAESRAPEAGSVQCPRVRHPHHRHPQRRQEAPDGSLAGGTAHPHWCVRVGV